MSTVDQIRSAVLTSKGQFVTVKEEGVTVEVRSPPFTARHRYFSTVRPLGDSEKLEPEKAIIITRATLELVAACTYAPTGEPVFRPEDVDALLAAHHGPLIKGLIQTAMHLLTDGAAELGKASGATTSSPSPAPSESDSA